MEQIEILVDHFYNHTWYYPYMSPALKETIEEAFNRDQRTVLVNREELELMLGAFIHRISN